MTNRTPGMNGNYEFDTSEHIKDIQKKFQRLADEFCANVWNMLREELHEFADGAEQGGYITQNLRSLAYQFDDEHAQGAPGLSYLQAASRIRGALDRDPR